MLTSCGGSNVTTPFIPQQENSLISSTPTPSLITKPVKGYIYGYNTVTEEGENISNINVLDIPAYSPDSSGNVPLVSQVSSYLQQEYPQEFNNPDTQELCSKLNTTLSQYKPLPDYDSQAKLFSVYQDSQNDTPVPVNPDGQFEGNVLTGTEDSTVKLEVSLEEDNYAETELIASSDTLASSDASGVILKSCPEKIVAFPNDIVIFKVFSDPSIDLKKAGLKFTLKNNSIGCIAPPVYLCAFGKNKYNVAYGFLYIKKGLTTPVDTVITVTTGTGLSLNIYLEVVKRAASISGRVYPGDKALIKGYVKSIGPKAHCKLDNEGNYSLPAVFCGSDRSVIATYWVEENGKQVKYREEKVIELFISDVTGFDFGIQPTPTPVPTITPTFTPSVTPTRHPPEEHFYSKQISVAIMYYTDWEEQLGREAAMQKTVDWINRTEPSESPIPECMVKAYIERNDIIIEFNDGMIDSFETVPRSLNVIPDATPVNQEFEKSFKKTSINSYAGADSNKTCFDPNIIILSPMSWQFDKHLTRSVHYDLAGLIENFNYYNITNKVTAREAIDIDFEHPHYNVNFKKYRAVFICNLSSTGLNNQNNIVTPWDYEKISDYGLVYILTHGGGGIFACLGTTNHPEIYRWLMEKTCGEDWICAHQYLTRDELIYLQNYQGDPNQYKYQKGGYVPVIYLRKSFFTKLNAKAGENFKRSIVYMSACHSYELKDDFSNAGLYIGYDGSSWDSWQSAMAYYLFYYMFFHHLEPVGFPTDQQGYPIYDPMEVIGDPPYPQDVPLSAQESYDILDRYYKVNHWPGGFETVRLTLSGSTDKQIYCPASADIIVHKK
jgi:hypothetical protein